MDEAAYFSTALQLLQQYASSCTGETCELDCTGAGKDITCSSGSKSAQRGEPCFCTLP